MVWSAVDFLGDFWWKSFFALEKARVKFSSRFESVCSGFGFFQGSLVTLKNPVAPILPCVCAFEKSGGTGFVIPVAPVSACQTWCWFGIR
jgi:hypothetical protein